MENYLLIELPNNTKLKILNNHVSDEMDVSSEEFSGKLNDIIPSITELCNHFSKMFKNTDLKKASIEFGFDIGIESSGLVALITKAKANTNFSVTLEWEYLKNTN